jgi:hypothetical protein
MALNKSIRKINMLKDDMISERRRKAVVSWQQNSKKQQGSAKEERRESKDKNLMEMTEAIRR